MALCSLAIAAGVMGVAMVVRRLVWRRFGGPGPWALAACGPGFGYGRACGGGPGRRGGPWRGGFGGGPGRSLWLRAIFSRLDTTPGQEREIRSAIEDFQKTARDAKDALRGAREHVARAIGGESFDEAAAGEATDRADGAASRIKDAATATLRRVHAVLDASQRERLAEILAKGPRFGRRRRGNPYRDAAI